jgi:hypothetical protein
MCVKDHDHSRRGSKKISHDKQEDEFESHFKTSMLFTKSMKSL